MSAARNRIQPAAGALLGAGSPALATVGAMYLAAWLGLLEPVPSLLAEPVLGVMPGPLFGFLIDTLQHLGKVLEEAGLILGNVVALMVLGALTRAPWVADRVPQPRALAALVAWAATVLVVYPLAGHQVLALDAGLSVPLVWAAVYAAFFAALELGIVRLPALDEAPDPVRRRLLQLAPAAIGTAGIALVLLREVPGWVRAVVDPPEARASVHGEPGGITPARAFYVVSKNFTDPQISARGWSLSVRGEVTRPRQYSYSELLALPRTAVPVTMECISNLVGGPQISTNVFAGVPLRDIITAAVPTSKADSVAFHCRDGYTETLPLAAVMQDDQILVAHQLAGAPLAPQHGFPARILVPGRYGLKSAKWLEALELTAGERKGHWEQQGFDRDAYVRTTSRFDEPKEGQIVSRPAVSLSGIAFSGARGVSAVEWSADEGRTWSSAHLRPPISQGTWVGWQATWQPRTTGQYTLMVRARDGLGALQAANASPSFPRGAAGYHRIHVNVRGQV